MDEDGEGRKKNQTNQKSIKYHQTLMSLSHANSLPVPSLIKSSGEGVLIVTPHRHAEQHRASKWISACKAEYHLLGSEAIWKYGL